MYRSWLTRIIAKAGGKVEDGLFVTEPGVLILQASETTPQANDLFADLNIIEGSPYEWMAEFNARLTYLSFSERAPEGGPTYLERITSYRHNSIFSATCVTFLLAGVSAEASMEMLAHGEGKVARLTTSRTKAMSEPLYRIVEPLSDWQRREVLAIEDARKSRSRANTTDEAEVYNKFNFGAKATALTYTMSLKDYHALFIGRLKPHGNELEVIDLCTRMCKQLHERYPLIIKAPEAYAAMSNGAKYGE